MAAATGGLNTQQPAQFKPGGVGGGGCGGVESGAALQEDGVKVCKASPELCFFFSAEQLRKDAEFQFLQGFEDVLTSAGPD